MRGILPHPVRHILLDRRDTLKAVCERAGDIAYEPARRAVNGETRPTWELAQRIADVVGLPVEVLFRVDELREDVEVSA